MRILFLCHEYPPYGGGAGMAMKHLAEALGRQGQEVVVLTVGLHEDIVEEQGVSVRRFSVWPKDGKIGGWRTWVSYLHKAPRELGRVIASFEPDILHSFFVVPSGFLMAKYSESVPHITTAVGGDIHDPTRLLAADNNQLIRLMAGKAVRNAKFVTACSMDFERRIRLLFPTARIRQIPFPVKNAVVNLESRPEFPYQGKFVVSVLGRLIRRKRIDLVLRAVASLNDSNVIVMVMGDGPELVRLQAIAIKLGIGQQVIFLGRTVEPEKSNYLRGSDVFCLTSEYESFGLVYVEAMLAGTPVIASAVSGPMDIVRHGIDGYLVRPGDPDALAARIQELRDHPARRLSMGKEAILGAERFCPEAIASTYTQLYHEARRDRR